MNQLCLPGINQRVADRITWYTFFVIIVVYGLVYARSCFENNDTGFILGIAHQLHIGQSLYRDIDYVRPPLTPYLHSIAFYAPWGLSPLLADRIFTLFQIGIYSALSSLIAKSALRLSSSTSAIIASLSFIWSFHNFPPMGWHTVDGIFFSVASLYFLSLRLISRAGIWTLYASALLATFAALAKQSFYPILIINFALYVLWLEWGRFQPWKASRQALEFLFAILCSLLACALLLTALRVPFPEMLQSISSQTEKSDLFSSAVIAYARDILSKSSVTVLPLALSLCIFYPKFTSDRIKYYSFILSSSVLLLSVAGSFLRAPAWTSPQSVFDAAFVSTAAFSLFSLIKTRERSWLVILALHSVAWCASISWGYQTIALYSAPVVIVIASCISSVSRAGRDSRSVLKSAVMPCLFVAGSLASFWVGNRYCYSLEGPLRRSDMDADMGQVSPLLSGIMSSNQHFSEYTQLLSILRGLQVDKSSFLVLPNMPLSHYLTGTVNPIGNVWPMNAEISIKGLRGYKELFRQANERVEYAIVRKGANPSPSSPGKFGSKFTSYIISRWNLVDVIGPYQIFRNPRSSGE